MISQDSIYRACCRLIATADFRSRAWAILAGLLLSLTGFSSRGQEPSQYPLPPEAERIEGTPEGKIEGPFQIASKIFPGTQREYWLYIPQQLDPSKPACTMIVQDGINRARNWRLPEVLDNLIHANQVPPIIGIFVNPGVVPAASESAQSRFNRSFEYDSMGDAYARFLLEELIPEVSKSYSLSTHPNDRALAGASSGGICAFNAAWERPDAFRRVLSTIGTFVGLRGANEFPTLIRKVEPKPLRVFLQDGERDLNIYAGNWWLANQDMLSALQWAGYEVNHVWGEEGHSGEHAAAIMPDALRWLWKDYPQAVKLAAPEVAKRRLDVLLAEADWQEVSSGHQLAESPACNAKGELFFSDSRAGRIYRIGEDGKTRVFKDQSGRITSLAFGPDGSLYAIRDGKQIVRFNTNGDEQVVLDKIDCQRLITLDEGLYYSDDVTPALHWVSYDGQKTLTVAVLEPLAAFTPTGDHGFLHAVGRDRAFTLNFQIAAGSGLEYRQRFGYLHLPYMEPKSGVSSMATDTQGNVYVASALGIQILDQLGRVNLILRKPGKEPITGIAFGGTTRSTLYATVGEKVYARNLKTRGVYSFEAAIALPKPGL